MSRSFDVLGSKEKAVAIVEIHDEEKDREKEIAEEITKKQKSVKSVLKKESMREGDYRTRKYKLIAGDKNTEVLHKEYGYALKLDPQKAYFSVRESTERQHIARQVEAGELVMVMFAGVGPYAIAIAKSKPGVEKIIAVEINPDAVEYMKHNIRINKLSHKIIPVLGDVRTACKKWYGKCDRVVMPLPLGAEDFLDIAVKCTKSDGTIHFYSWGDKGSLYDAAEKAIDESLKNLNREYKITGRRIVLPYAPGRYKVCVEFKVL
jgi:tRNA (guanine37-N1)-methyltransferase